MSRLREAVCHVCSCIEGGNMDADEASQVLIAALHNTGRIRGVITPGEIDRRFRGQLPPGDLRELKRSAAYRIRRHKREGANAHADGSRVSDTVRRDVGREDS